MDTSVTPPNTDLANMLAGSGASADKRLEVLDQLLSGANPDGSFKGDINGTSVNFDPGTVRPTRNYSENPQENIGPSPFTDGSNLAGVIAGVSDGTLSGQGWSVPDIIQASANGNTDFSKTLLSALGASTTYAGHAADAIAGNQTDTASTVQALIDESKATNTVALQANLKLQQNDSVAAKALDQLRMNPEATGNILNGLNTQSGKDAAALLNLQQQIDKVDNTTFAQDPVTYFFKHELLEPLITQHNDLLGNIRTRAITVDLLQKTAASENASYISTRSAISDDSVAASAAKVSADAIIKSNAATVASRQGNLVIDQSIAKAIGDVQQHRMTAAQFDTMITTKKLYQQEIDLKIEKGTATLEEKAIDTQRRKDASTLLGMPESLTESDEKRMSPAKRAAFNVVKAYGTFGSNAAEVLSTIQNFGIGDPAQMAANKINPTVRTTQLSKFFLAGATELDHIWDIDRGLSKPIPKTPQEKAQHYNDYMDQKINAWKSDMGTPNNPMNLGMPLTKLIEAKAMVNGQEISVAERVPNLALLIREIGKNQGDAFGDVQLMQAVKSKIQDMQQSNQPGMFNTLTKEVADFYTMGIGFNNQAKRYDLFGSMGPSQDKYVRTMPNAEVTGSSNENYSKFKSGSAVLSNITDVQRYVSLGLSQDKFKAYKDARDLEAIAGTQMGN